MPSIDTDSIPGDVLQYKNGDRYVVLPNHKLAYLGNAVLDQSVGLKDRTGDSCTILGRMGLLPYRAKDDEDFESDWDLLRGRERIPVPLPRGCTCGHEALTAVLTCLVHEVKIAKDETSVPYNLIRFRKKVRVSPRNYAQGAIVARGANGLWPHPFSERVMRTMLSNGWIEPLSKEDSIPEEELDRLFGPSEDRSSS